MLGSDPGIVEPGRDRVRLLNLAVFVLEEQRPAPMKHARPSVHDGRGILSDVRAASARFDTEKPYGLICEKRVEQTDRI